MWGRCAVFQMASGLLWENAKRVAKRGRNVDEGDRRQKGWIYKGLDRYVHKYRLVFIFQLTTLVKKFPLPM